METVPVVIGVAVLGSLVMAGLLFLLVQTPEKPEPLPSPSLPTFRSRAACPKCGGKGFERRWCNGKTYGGSDFYASWYCDLWRSAGGKEHFHVQCNCGYAWGEMAMDTG